MDDYTIIAVVMILMVLVAFLIFATTKLPATKTSQKPSNTTTYTWDVSIGKAHYELPDFDDCADSSGSDSDGGGDGGD